MKRFKDWSKDSKNNVTFTLVYLAFVAAVIYFCS